jgi:hypothetical protein
MQMKPILNQKWQIVNRKIVREKKSQSNLIVTFN